MTGIQYLDLPGVFGAVQQFQNNAQRSRLLDLQAQMEQQKVAAAQRQLDRQNTVLASLPENERAVALLDPSAYAAARAKHLFHDPKDNYISVPDVGLVDISGGNPTLAVAKPPAWSVAPLPGAGASPGANLLNAAPGAAPGADAGGDLTLASLRQWETGGAKNPNTAENPNSSARGTYQFIESTFLDQLKRNAPDIIAATVGPNADLKDPAVVAKLQALRSDPKVADRLAGSYAAENALVLKQAELPATPRNLVVTHFLGGAGGTRLLKADPNAPGVSAASPEAVTANRRIFYDEAGRPRTVGEILGMADEVVTRAQQQMAGTKTAAAPGAPGAPGAAAAGGVPAGAVGIMMDAKTGTPHLVGQHKDQVVFVDANNKPVGIGPMPGSTQPQAGGPLTGNAVDAQMYNIYVRLEQKRASGQALTADEQMLSQLATRHLMAAKVVPTSNGGFAEVKPQPLPTMAVPAAQTDTVPNPLAPAPVAAAPAPAAVAPAPAAPAAAPAAPAAAPPPAPAAPGGDRVTQLREGKPTPNNEQSISAGFATRLTAANQVFDSLEAQGLQVPSLWDRGVGSVPLAGNYLTSSKYQQLEQAQREFVNAQLRRESGAAISASEFANAAQQYFPQPGDSPAVLAQKKRSREMAVANMKLAAGPAPIGAAPPLAADSPAAQAAAKMTDDDLKKALGL